jgi:threonine dehydrogenase-like Zn-dependent dehydrogenase
MRQVDGSNISKNLIDPSSELHVYRGHQASATDFIMGHEFTGTITEIGSDVKLLKKGDYVVVPFTTAW